MLHFSFRIDNLTPATIRIFGVALCSVCLSAEASAQQTTPPASDASQPSATLAISAREVLLDVVVTDRKGQPVSGLTASDFTVKEEGAPQQIAHLEEHHPMSAEDLSRQQAVQPLPPNTFTNYTPIANTNASTVILFDALDSSIQTQMEVRAQFIDFLEHMQPGTAVAIFQIDTEMRLIQGFSSDPQVLLQAAKSKRDMPSLLRPLTGPGTERRFVKTDILRTGFQMMGRYLAGFPGRKNLIWLTGAIPSTYLSDPLGSSFGKSFKDDFAVLEDRPGDLMDALTLSRVAVYPIDSRGLRTPPQFEAANNGPISPGANMAFERAQAFQHIDLDVMAEATGGKAYYNSNGLKQVLGRIIANGSNYYTLAYATTNQTWNGQFRHIKVTVDRPGVQVQCRQGYYAVDRAQQEQRLLAAMQKRKARPGNPFGEESPATQDPTAQAGAPAGPQGAGVLVKHAKGSFEASMQLGVAPPTEVILTASLAESTKVVKLDKKAPLPKDNFLEPPYRGKPFRTYTVFIRADARALRLARTATGMRHGNIEFVTLVYDQLGNRVNSLLTTAEVNVTEEHYRQMLQGGLAAQQEIAVPVKDNYFLRIGVHDVASDHIGALEIAVDQVHPGASGQGMQNP
jgi:VWFA-related protein